MNWEDYPFDRWPHEPIPVDVAFKQHLYDSLCERNDMVAEIIDCCSEDEGPTATDLLLAAVHQRLGQMLIVLDDRLGRLETAVFKERVT